MKPVMQTLFGNEKGNCMQACLASLLELALDQVPNFVEYRSRWHDKYVEFCRSYGVYPLYFPAEAVESPEVFQGYYDLSVETERSLLHSVIAKDGQIIHDPYPGGSTITKIVGYTIFVSLLDPEISSPFSRNGGNKAATVRQKALRPATEKTRDS